MIRTFAIFVIVVAFAIAATVAIRVNRLPHFAPSADVSAELTSLLRQNHLAPQPMGDPRGVVIDNALRFSQPGCAADGFLLPLADVLLADVQAIRFTELTGATYRSTTLSFAPTGNIAERRATRAFQALKAAFGQPAARHADAVLALFTPVDCPVPTPDMRAFWAPE